MKTDNKYLSSKSIKNIIVFFVVIFSLNSYQVFSQAEKESEYKRLKSKLEIEDKKLDSLNSILKQKIDFINIQKSKPDYDKNKIKDLLSSTATLTNSIEKKQLEINKLTKKYDVVKNELYIKYSAQIDSVNKSNLPQDKKNNLTTKLIEKRLLVSPKINILTFEPEKVIKIGHSENVVEQKIYSEFLTSAYLEIENKLTEIKELKREIETILTLHKETSTFLEEADFDNDISYFNTTIKSSITSAEPNLFDVQQGRNNSLEAQTRSFSKILNQLEINKQPQKQTYSISNITEKKDLKEFKKLIDQVEQQLLDYKNVVENKLKNF